MAPAEGDRVMGSLTPIGESKGWERTRLFVRIIVLALALNVLAWAGAAWRLGSHGNWTQVSLAAFFLLGLVAGRWWALLVTCAFAVLHAIPVYFGLLPGYLSTWEEALWWAFALVLLLILTALGVLGRWAIRWLRSRFFTKSGEPRRSSERE